MKTVQIKLSDIGHIRDLPGLLAKHLVELDLQQGRYIINAKSPMGIYALDLLNPIDFIIRSEDDGIINAVLADIKQWIV